MGSAAQVVAVIPARYGSTRLPAKPLADINGKPMIQWVYERTRQAKGIAAVYVATDDERVAQVVRGFGGQVVMTSPDIQSGTDRVWAVACEVAGDVFVNVQGDEPLIEASAIEAGVELVTSGRFSMGTVMVPLADEQELRDPSVVKVIADKAGRSIYFSRHPIPYSRGPLPKSSAEWVCRRHVGLYIYTRETLKRFSLLPPSGLEKAEVLEQLRALDAGIPIGIIEVDFTSIGVDTQEDLEKVRKILKGR
jgi:3-deoxy-D-manno-octulosonate cytidylyltransferase